MKIFFDAEFTGLHQNTTLISIGLIAETGQSFYAEFIDYDKSQVDDRIQENVIDNLLFGSQDTPYPVGYPKIANEQMKGNARNIFAGELKEWLWKLHFEFGGDSKIAMWSDCLTYDWVLFCEMWGGALKIPECIYYIPFDLSTLFLACGVDPDIDREEYSGLARLPGLTRHNALWDAMVIRGCYEKLSYEASQGWLLVERLA